MISWKEEWKKLAFAFGGFLACFYLPVDNPRFSNAIFEALYLVQWYAEEHVLLCLVPAFFIAGAISVFVSQESVMKYLGPRANKVLAYGVASVAGTVLAVCSCTVLPLFAGIHSMGAGLGPASAFLYSGPAINVLAIVLTSSVLGLKLGVARAVGAITFSVIIGLVMHFLFRKEEEKRAAVQMAKPAVETGRPLWHTALYFASMVGILVFANWAKPDPPTGVWYTIFAMKWYITSCFAAALGIMLVAWFDIKIWKIGVIAAAAAIMFVIFPGKPVIPFTVAFIGLSIFTSTDKGEAGEWFGASWGFAMQILPLLLLGVLISGLLLGRAGHEGLIPSHWISGAVGGNSLFANFFASITGAFMYFATLTEVPILQGLIGSGMGQGPALTLLLAGPALSLPSIIVLKSIMGWKKTIAYVSIVVVMSTIAGMIYGAIA